MKTTNFDFLQYRKFTFVGSVAVIVLGIIFFFIRGGFNLGLDFQGGIKATIQIHSEEEIKVDDIRSMLATELPGILVTERVSAENMFEITYKYSEIEPVESETTNQVKLASEENDENDGDPTEEETEDDEDSAKLIPEDNEEAIEEEVVETDQIEVLGNIDITAVINEQVLPILRERYGEGLKVRVIGEDINFDVESRINRVVDRIENLSFNSQKSEEEYEDDAGNKRTIDTYIFNNIEKPDGYAIEDLKSFLKENTRLGETTNFEIVELVEAVQVDSFEPTVGKDIQSVALQVSALIIILILGYLALRFKFKFGVAAVVAVIHDSLFVLAILAITGLEVGVMTVTAILTIIGYSLNDTIVVFDRIRENSENIKREEYMFVINKSINQVLGRTIITSVTTLLAVLSLLILGGSAIFELAFSISIGIVVGTYSSIFVASPVLMIWEDYLHKRAEKKSRRKKEEKGKKKIKK